MSKPLPDSGNRLDYVTGSNREPSTGKGRYDLVSPYALRRLAQRYEDGLEKYSERNWEKGQPVSRCYDSAIRHMNQYIMGMDDEDHLAAAVFNIFAIMHFEEIIPHMQDLPNRILEIDESHNP
ncbi:dATP/dGTP diphosphohydrolase domain-containing protein [Paenibacillus sp. FSL H7-0331]|uniref:dATP/dGTP diphosphohydrolase domain-containing protein n=1 Tax=Paenibacillus sp. FSL H7-0331 TaxID=1920421 RepID=UPI00096EB33E|nr:dATP/dGTP diphosphohydrolase domain-containing protein [Paenibacillus sp. FSL H7-0331]OMF19838.1 hypothetical protein BK127_02725 [Paenibacillus sp. FSL H7-0331]